METVTALRTWPQAIQLETDAGSILVVFPGGVILKIGFLDSPEQALTDFSHRLYWRAGVLYHELNNHRGTIQQIPVAQVHDTPQLRTWLARAETFIP